VSNPVLSSRQLNRSLLTRQLLLERSDLSVTGALEQLAGLQNQYAPSAYVALWSRVREFRRHHLTEALEQRRAVQGTLMRATIHAVSAGDYPLFAEGVRRARREWWMRVQHHQVEGLDMEEVASFLRRHLSQGPRRQAELLALLQDEGFPRIAWSGAGLWLDMVRVPPSGTWDRRRADLYGLAEDWLGPSSVSESEGIEHLVRRYLSAFGPAPLADVVSWAGLPAATLRPVLERVGSRRFRDQAGVELFDLPESPLPDPDTPAPVRFMPVWDATLLVHARRTQILPEHYRHLVFNVKTPHSVPTFLIDGAVAGTWRYEKGRILLQPFGDISKKSRQELEDEAERLAEFHGPEG
jgi:hypothetical protein